MKINNVISFYVFSILILILYFYTNYSNLYIEIHDNLDQHFGWYKLLSDNNAWFEDNSKILPFMGGTLRGIFLPETQLVNFIFIYLNPLFAHCILIITKFTIGYFSFIFLANYLFNEKNIPKIYICLISISFALTPGNENLYIAQASLPLILYLYLKYINEKSTLTLILIFIYPILSELTRFGMFILIFMSIHFLYLLYYKNPKFKYSILSIIFLSLGYLFFEYRLILSMVLSNEETIRKTMILLKDGNFYEVLFRSFLTGQYHFSNYNFVFIPFLIYLLFFKFKENIILPKTIYLLASVIIFNCIVYTIYTTTDIKYLLWNNIPPLAGWNFSRFIWFNSFFWHLFILGLIAYTYSKKNKILTICFLFAQILMVIILPAYGNDFYRTIKCNYISKCENSFSYNEFYSTKLFDEIKKSINYSKNEKVISFGFHPSVLTYNGFFTIDGYHNAYYQSYKNKFRDLIKPGLDESDKYKSYFENWGGRAYIFSENSNYSPHRTPNNTPINIPIDFQVARNMEIKYIISNDPIILNRNLKFIGLFTKSNSPYRLSIYEVVY